MPRKVLKSDLPPCNDPAAGVLMATCRSPASATSFSLPSLSDFSIESFINGTNSSSLATNCYSNVTG